ncbi:hypothetical protein D5086_031180 [Populus alba]|uniref:Uncharacterized protein n=1 Tax=Populus alba TaxID=43335 RepID=A0ACC4AQK4_POPAL
MQLRTRLSLEYCTVLLESCIQSKSLFQGKLIHQHLLKCLHRTQETNLTNFDVPFEKLVDFYIACNELKIARHVFDKRPHRPKNVVLWNLLIRAYAWNGPYEEAIDLYYKMLGYGITPNRFTFPFVLKACSALKEVSEGREIHFDIKRLRLESNVYVSTALVDFYAKWFSLHEGSYDEVARLLVQMQYDVSPNSSTIVGVLPAVAQVNSLRHGKEIHGFCVRRGFVGDVVVGTGILDVYGKCQCIDYARRIFDMMGIVKNEVTWSAMVGAYVVCDFMREALELFCQLLMLKDDGIVLSAVTLATVIRVCANLTDLSMGSCLHCYAIKSGFVLDLMVGNTLLSMYAKCYVQNGNSEEGLCMFLEMQLSGINPEKATLASVLPACAHLAALHYGSCSHCYAIVCGFTADTMIWEQVSKKIQKLGPESTGNFVLLSNMYSAVGRWDDAAQVRITQKEQGFEKSPGCSWIEISGVVHTFVGGGYRSHPQLAQISNKLDELLVEMKRLGYQTESSYVFQDVEEEEKERGKDGGFTGPNSASIVKSLQNLLFPYRLCDDSYAAGPALMSPIFSGNCEATDAHVSVYRRGTSVLLWISTALLNAIAVHGFRNSDTISISFSHEPSRDTSTFSRLVYPTGSPSKSTVFLSENLLQQLLLIILMKLIEMGG